MEFRIVPETDHLRQGIDLGGLPEGKVDGFDDYSRKLRDREVEDEEWAMEYERSVARIRFISLSWPPYGVELLKKHYYEPKDVRLMIAFLRVRYEKHFGFPWDGPKEEQRKAIDRWIAFLEDDEDVKIMHGLDLRRRR